MQEEVTGKSVAVIIKGAKISEKVLEKALGKLLEAQKNKQPKVHRGKQTLKQLAGQNAGLANIEITNQNIKSFTHLTKEQMQAAGYGVHHESDDRKYLIMGNGTHAFAVLREPKREKDNPLKNAEMSMEDDYGMIDGIINNGSREETKEKPSIRERLAEAKRECSERTPPEKAREGRSTPEHNDR